MTKHVSIVLKWLFYLTTIFIWILFLWVIFSFFNADNQTTVEKRKVALPDSLQSACIKTQEDNLLSILKACWAKKDRKSFISIMNLTVEKKQANEKEINSWLRHQIDNDPLFSNDKQIHLLALNKLIPNVENIKGYAQREQDRAYLTSIANSNYEYAFVAILVLGYYLDDADVPLFVSAAESNSEFKKQFSIESLIRSCSPKAKSALQEVVSFPSTAKYLERELELKRQVNNNCLNIE